MRCSPAELTYGETLRLPGEIIASHVSKETITDRHDFLQALHKTMTSLTPTTPRRLRDQCTHVPDDLLQGERVFVRRDSVKAPLARPYDDPFQVLGRMPKYFNIERNGKSDTVSLDRLNPAYGPEFSSTAAPPSVINVPSTH